MRHAQEFCAIQLQVDQLQATTCTHAGPYNDRQCEDMWVWKETRFYWYTWFKEQGEQTKSMLLFQNFYADWLLSLRKCQAKAEARMEENTRMWAYTIKLSSLISLLAGELWQVSSQMPNHFIVVCICLGLNFQSPQPSFRRNQYCSTLLGSLSVGKVGPSWDRNYKGGLR